MWPFKKRQNKGLKDKWKINEGLLQYYSTWLNTKFILLINIKMPKMVGILTFISCCGVCV